MHSFAMVGLCKDTLSGIVSILFVKENYFWKLLCLSCTGFLLMQLFMDYFSLKPTVSTVEEIKLSQNDFPDVLVCLGNGFDHRRMERYGYESDFQYFTGLRQGINFIGWNGLNVSDPFRKVSDNY